MIEKTMSKIEKVFERVREKGLTFGEHESKKRLSDRTVETYADVVKAYANYLHKTHGISDIARAKPRHAEEFIERQLASGASAWSMRRLPHALHAFQTAAVATGVYAHRLKLGDKRNLLKSLTDKGVFRKSSDSQTLKANHGDYQKVNEAILKSASPVREVTAHIHQVQRYLGARIHEAVKMRKEDLQFHNNGSVTATIKGKGGLVRQVTTTHKPTVDMLIKAVAGKRDGAPVFQIPNGAGQDKSRNAAQKSMKENIRAAAKRAGADRDGKKYSSHSARKAFAQSRMDGYYKQTKAQLHKEIARRIAGDASLKTKYDKTQKNVRDKISEKSKNKQRELNHKELCKWLVSTDLGHGRLDVVRYYCTYPGDLRSGR